MQLTWVEYLSYTAIIIIALACLIIHAFMWYTLRSKEIMKKVKWTVLHETPLDNPYMLGGTGGINQIFKNIETGEVLRLDEMLKFTKFELYSMGLTKALHPKTGWYIRTLPNNLKIDNLG
ncbi:hypothetical protein [Mycoplasmopsis felifaucium]|uniref:Uncharacterized protein n=1 Tax=Mycoplasmopsis felifaucium TaxID=35768 RepID=A0ABZ2RPQ6_9BACT